MSTDVSLREALDALGLTDEDVLNKIKECRARTWRKAFSEGEAGDTVSLGAAAVLLSMLLMAEEDIPSPGGVPVYADLIALLQEYVGEWGAILCEIEAIGTANVEDHMVALQVAVHAASQEVKQ